MKGASREYKCEAYRHSNRLAKTDLLGETAEKRVDDRVEEVYFFKEIKG
jgi:hypothetical protein